MQKNKTYFEQVPLDAIRNILKEEMRQPSGIETPEKRNAKTAKQGSLLAADGDRSGGRS